jgi:hypothetical protein
MLKIWSFDYRGSGSDDQAKRDIFEAIVILEPMLQNLSILII